MHKYIGPSIRKNCLHVENFLKCARFNKVLILTQLYLKKKIHNFPVLGDFILSLSTIGRNNKREFNTNPAQN